MIGQVVSHYRVLSKVGGGGMGVVYEAEDLELDRHVALKFLPAEMAEDQEALNRFRREARAASALNHPHICTIHEIGEHEGQPFLILELLSGETLAEKIKLGPLPIDEAVRFGTHLADALDTAHSAGIVHRDIKPANLFITQRGDLKVLDFGLAKREVATGDDSLTSAPTMRASDGPLTNPGTTMGTVHYMSPEQVRAEELDARTDVFSAGVVLYQMATGRLPFDGSSPGVIFAAILGKQPQPPSELNQEVTPNLEAVIGRALSKERDDRYQTALDLMTDLGEQPISVDSWIATAPPEKAQTAGAFRATEELDRPDSSISQKHSRLLWGAIAIVAILAAGSAWLSFDSGRGPVSANTVVEDERRIVVLPFENLGATEDGYFAAGVSDEITSRLGSIDGLTIISSSSARRYAGSSKTLAEIAQELDVSHVVSGSVRWVEDDSGTRVRIQPELVRVDDQARVWGETIDEQVEDIFAIQGRIAEQVAARLGIELSDAQRLALEESLTDSPEAYQEYLRGVAERIAHTGDGYAKAISHFERALELDPRFAEAWAQMSRTKGAGWRLGRIQDATLPDQARSDADRAVSLKPESAEAQVALGMYYYDVAGDYERAVEILSLVTERHPDNLEAAMALGVAARRLGRVQVSLRAFERSLRLDPDQARTHDQLGANLGALGRWNDASEHYLRSIELDPSGHTPYLHMAHLTVARGGSIEEARSYLARSPSVPLHDKTRPDWYERNFDVVADLVDRDPSDPFAYAYLGGSVHRAMGDPDTARPYFEQLLQMATPYLADEVTTELHSMAAYAAALAHAGMGDVEQALHWADAMLSYRPNDAFQHVRNSVTGAAKVYAWAGEVERAIDTIEQGLFTPAGYGGGWTYGLHPPGLRLDPDWDALRGNPRFEALIERLEKEGPAVSGQSATSQ
jgi:serine/threonine protein kinase/tetratricopeptide (TPR) repeat protein